MLDLVIGSDRTGRQLFLRDVATLERGDQDPPRRLLRYDGKPAIGLGISTVQGGNVVTMGDGVRRKLDELKADQPIGIEIGEINFQPEAVTAATNEFMFNLAKAVTIVFVVLLFAMGRKTGLIIGLVLFLTIMATFFVMYMKGDLLMERISLGALIIALCMLTDNAIIVIEGIKVGIEARQGQARGGPRGGRAEPVAALRRDGHRRHRLRRDRPVGRQHRRVLQLAVLGHPDFAEPELGLVDHVTPLLELPALQAEGRRRHGDSSDPYGGLPSSGSTAACWRWRSASAGRWWSLSIVAFVAGALRLHARSSRASSRPRRGRSSWSTSSCRPAPTSARPRRSPATVEQLHPGAARRHARHVVRRRRRPALPARLLARSGRTAPSCSSWSMSTTANKIDGLIADIQKHLDEQHPERQRRRQEVPARARARAGASRRASAAPIRRSCANSADQAIDDSRRRRRRRLRPQRLARAREGDPPRPARAAGAPQRHHARRGGPGPGRPASRAAWSASTASRATPAAGVFPQETRLLPIVARPPLGRAQRRRTRSTACRSGARSPGG